MMLWIVQSWRVGIVVQVSWCFSTRAPIALELHLSPVDQAVNSKVETCIILVARPNDLKPEQELACWKWPQSYGSCSRHDWGWPRDGRERPLVITTWIEQNSKLVRLDWHVGTKSFKLVILHSCQMDTFQMISAVVLSNKGYLGMVSLTKPSSKN